MNSKQTCNSVTFYFMKKLIFRYWQEAKFYQIWLGRLTAPRLTVLIIFGKIPLPANVWKWVFSWNKTWRNYKFAWNSCWMSWYHTTCHEKEADGAMSRCSRGIAEASLRHCRGREVLRGIVEATRREARVQTSQLSPPPVSLHDTSWHWS